MIFRLPNLLACGVMALILSVGMVSAQENLFYKKKADGDFFFQLQNIRKGASYSVQLVDVASGKTLVTIGGFEKGAVPNALKAEWKPKAKLNALCFWNILRDGKNVSPPVQAVPMPEKFHVGQAKIKRALNGISWNQDVPAISRVFVANRTGMLIAWAKPWEFTNAGSHLAPWDFKDAGSVRSYRTDSDIHAFVQMVPLGKRWMVLGDVPFDVRYSQLKHLAKVKLPKIPYAFNLTLPGATLASGTKGKADAVYHAKPGMPVRVSLDEVSKKKMGGRRFEILLFLNGEFIHEEAQGVDPYTFILPEFPGVKGKHHFTVNIIDYHGNIASRTVTMKFEPLTKNTPAAPESR